MHTEKKPFASISLIGATIEELHLEIGSYGIAKALTLRFLVYRTQIACKTNHQLSNLSFFFKAEVVELIASAGLE